MYKNFNKLSDELATTLDVDKISAYLAETPDEEKKMDKLFSDLAKKEINYQASKE